MGSTASNTPSIPDSEARETVLDALDRREREATAGTRVVAGLNCAEMELLALSRNHLRALIEVGKAAHEFFIWHSEMLPTTGTAYGMRFRNLEAALAPLLTEPEE